MSITYKKKSISGVSVTMLKIDSVSGEVRYIKQGTKFEADIFTDSQSGYVTATQSEYESLVAESTDFNIANGHPPNPPG
jgi:hypothetical protein